MLLRAALRRSSHRRAQPGHRPLGLLSLDSGRRFLPDLTTLWLGQLDPKPWLKSSDYSTDDLLDENWDFQPQLNKQGRNQGITNWFCVLVRTFVPCYSFFLVVFTINVGNRVHYHQAMENICLLKRLWGLADARHRGRKSSLPGLQNKKVALTFNQLCYLTQATPGQPLGLTVAFKILQKRGFLKVIPLGSGDTDKDVVPPPHPSRQIFETHYLT